jgi:hypothetical protein
VGLALYFGRRQVQTLRLLRTVEAGNVDERRYLRAQAYRRLFCSGLMVLFAALLVGSIFLDLQRPAILKEVREARDKDPDARLTEEQDRFVRLFSMYWITALLVVLLLLALAALDFWATARFGLRQHRQLQADHRSLLQQDMARHRRDRNGSS